MTEKQFEKMKTSIEDNGISLRDCEEEYDVGVGTVRIPIGKIYRLNDENDLPFKTLEISSNGKTCVISLDLTGDTSDERMTIMTRPHRQIKECVRLFIEIVKGNLG